MRSRQRVIQALRNAGKASPRSIKGPIGRASRRFRSGFRGPLVTVVLAISDQDTTKIGPMLWDLRNQSYRNLEVRLQPWGRYDAVRAVAEEHADADWRIVLARTVAPDASTARGDDEQGERGHGPDGERAGGASGGPWLQDYNDRSDGWGVGYANGVTSTVNSDNWNRSPYFDDNFKSLYDFAESHSS